jgi:hypothetical protein
MHPRSVLLPAALAVCAGLFSACGSTLATSDANRLEVIATDNHLVAVAYRAQGRSQDACIHKIRTHAINSDREAAQCLSDGLKASGLEAAIGRLRRHVLDIGKGHSEACRRATTQLASIVAQEQGYVHASQEDLARLDAQAYSDDGRRAGETAFREAAPSAQVLRACADD